MAGSAKQASGEAPGCRLYLVTPPALEPARFAEELARALDAGDVACVQLRLKHAEDDAIRRAIDALLATAEERRTRSLTYDDLEEALPPRDVSAEDLEAIFWVLAEHGIEVEEGQEGS